MTKPAVAYGLDDNGAEAEVLLDRIGDVLRTRIEIVESVGSEDRSRLARVIEFLMRDGFDMKARDEPQLITTGVQSNGTEAAKA